MSLPPCGIASRELSARLRIAVARWLGSTVAKQVSSLNTDSISMCSPSVGRSSLAVSMISVLISTSLGCSGLPARERPEDAGSGPAPRARGLVDHPGDGGKLCGSFSRQRRPRISMVPVMTVRILLKSCAMPPVELADRFHLL